MITRIILLWSVILPFMLQGQVNINVQLPPAGLVQKFQLWNLVLVNNKEDMLDVTIKMNLQDAVTGQVVLSASSGNLLLARGSKMITEKDIQPILYNYNVPDLSKTYLPMGAYVACYQVISNSQKMDPLGEECTHINIDPLSPPLLNTPANQAEIQSPYPQFSWIPPTPFDMFGNLSYDILITEVLPGQSSVEAIEYNTPVYINSAISKPYESYASSFSKLDTGKIYAWQVIARNGLNYAAKTEIWTFTLQNGTPKQLTNNDSYILLQDDITGIYHVAKDKLQIKYYSFTKEYTSIVEITNEQGAIIKRRSQKINPGNNYFDFDLGSSFQRGKLYKVTLTSLDKKSHVLKFSINNK